MSSITIAFINQKTETFFERHAWTVFFGVSVIIALFGPGDMITGGATFQSGEAATFQGVSGMTWEQLGAAIPNAVNMIDNLVRLGVCASALHRSL